MKAFVLFAALALTLLACQQTAPQPAPNVLGTMRVRFVLEPAAKGAGLRPQVLSDIAASSPGGVQMRLLSTNTFTFGPRDQEGQRFVSATYAVRNADVNGKAYPNANNNISFLAVSTPNSLDETAIGEMLSYGGTPVAQPLLAQSFKPTHAMRYDFALGLPEVAPGGEDFQVFDESEVSSFATTSINPLNYGFVVRNPATPNSRSLPANPATEDFFGMVTFAMRFPLQATAAEDPFAFAMDFLVVTDSQTRVTQSLEQQSNNQVSSLATSLTGAVVNTLPGSPYGATPTRFVSSVRLARAPNNNPVFLVQAAQNIVVSSNADVATNGAITLRQAINQVATGGTIDLSGINGQTIRPSSSFVLGRNVTITNTASNPNVTLRGGPTVIGPPTTSLSNIQILEVQSGVTATIRHITIENGMARGAPARGGGILNAGTLTLENSKFLGNIALGNNGANATFLEGSAGESAQGGAIHNTGTLTISSSSFTNNRVVGGVGGNGIVLPVPPIPGTGGRGGRAEGGAIYNASGAILNLSSSVFDRNNATGGKGGNGAVNSTGSSGSPGLGGDANGGAALNAGTVNPSSLTFGTAANANTVVVGANGTGTIPVGSPTAGTAQNPNTNF
jgi:trimeric autotransporter adhesin